MIVLLNGYVWENIKFIAISSSSDFVIFCQVLKLTGYLEILTFSLLPHMPQKMKLVLKGVKIDSKMLFSLPSS
jgi:hypothetical protein